MRVLTTVTRGPLLGAAAAAMLLVSAVPAAVAAEAKPEPMPCVGFSATDKAGDHLQLDPLPAIPASLDITGVFFRYAPGADGKPVLTANLKITDLVEKPYSDAVGIEWEIQYTVAGFVYVAGAQVAPSGTTYYSGSWFISSIPTPPAQPAFHGFPARTTGRFIPGKDGIIEIVVPSEGLAGKTLTDVWARTRLNYTFAVPHQGQGSAALDRAPDGDKFGKPFTVAECPAETPSEPTPASQDPQQQPSPEQPSPQPQPNQQPQPAQQPAPAPGAAGALPASGPLSVSVAADKVTRATARKDGLRLRVRCSVQCNSTAVATVDKAVARKLGLGAKTATIASGKAAITATGDIPFLVKLSAKAKRALARRNIKKIVVTIVVTVTDRQGGQAKRVTKKITLR